MFRQTLFRQVIWSAMAAVLLLGLGCGYYMRMPAGGPLTREEALALPGAAFEPLSEGARRKYEETERTTPWAARPKLDLNWRFPLGPTYFEAFSGYAKFSPTPGYMYWCGFYPASCGYVMVPERPGAATCFIKSHMFTPPAPCFSLWWSFDERAWVKETGAQFYDYHWHGPGPLACLGGYTSTIYAIGKDMKPVAALRDATHYQVAKLFYLPFGLCGFGRVNHYYCGEMLWIPFRIWKAD